MIDGHLKLADVLSLPVVIRASDKHSVSEGFIGEKVKVLRDTEYSSAAVRSSLVSDTQLTGNVQLCVLIDGTVRKFPIARVNVDTPFYKGDLEARCMKAPIYDLMISNIPGSCGLEEPDQNVNSENVAPITTRAQKSVRGKLSSH